MVLGYHIGNIDKMSWIHYLLIEKKNFLKDIFVCLIIDYATLRHVGCDMIVE